MIRSRFFVAPLLLATLAPAPAPAQDSKPAPSASDVLTVRQHLIDLSLLQSLVPLKLTAAQIDALLPTVKAALAAAEKLRKEEEAALKGLATEIASAREAALGGEAISPEMEKKIGEANRAATSRFLVARRGSTEVLLEVLKEELTSAQKAEIERQSEKTYGGKRVPKQYANDPSKAPKDVVQGLALQGFIEGVLLSERAVAVLTDLKSATAKKSEP